MASRWGALSRCSAGKRARFHRADGVLFHIIVAVLEVLDSNAPSRLACLARTHTVHGSAVGNGQQPGLRCRVPDQARRACCQGFDENFLGDFFTLCPVAKHPQHESELGKPWHRRAIRGSFLSQRDLLHQGVRR